MNKQGNGEIKIVSYAVLGILALIIIIALFGSIYTIQAGSRGVLLTFGKPNMIAKTEGLHFKIPIVQSIIKMDVKTQKYEVLKTSAASKDLQIVTTDVTVNYYVNPDSVPTIYRDVGINYQDKIISPAVQEVVKASTATYTAEELITKRPEVKEKIDIGLRERLRDFGINVQQVSITNFDFSLEFNKAIEQKVTATQLKLKAEQDLQRIKIEAEQKIAQASAEAEALRLQKQQITPELIQLRQIEVQSKALDVQKEAIAKWNGISPQTLITGEGNSNVFPFFQVNK